MFVQFALQWILTLCITYILWSRRKLYKLSWQLPGPFAWPILGNILNVHPSSLHQYLDYLARKTPGPIRLWLGPILTVFIYDAENVEIILKSKYCLDKPYTFYKMFRDGAGLEGLFTMKAEKWKLHRRLVSPTLNLPSVRLHLPYFNKNLKEFVSSLPKNEYFDIQPVISKCKMSMFIEAALGQSNMAPETKKNMPMIFTVEIISRRCLQPLYHNDFIWSLTKKSKQLKEISMDCKRGLEKIYDDQMEKGDDGTFIAKLCEISKVNPNFTKEDVIGQSATILAGATETTSVASAYLALMLAMHPEYQEKVYEEVCRIMPDKNGEFTPTDLDNLTFTDLCMKETLRLFPSASIIGRVSSKPIKLSNNVEIPANIPLMINLRQLHLREKYYGPTARIFNPYRFLDEKIKNLPDSAYAPFSYGSRNCNGTHYAIASMKCMAAHLIRNYRLETSYKSMDEFQLMQNTSLRLVGNFMIKLEPRI